MQKQALYIQIKERSLLWLMGADHGGSGKRCIAGERQRLSSVKFSESLKKCRRYSWYNVKSMKNIKKENKIV